MNRATLIELQKIKDNHGRYIYSNSVGEKSGHHIFGIPVVVSNLLKGPSSGSVDIILSDFSKGYAIVDRQDTTVVRDNLTEKPFVKFYATKRVGGDVIEANAIKVLSHKIII
jgi:HK97 family phage major capsid protein